MSTLKVGTIQDTNAVEMYLCKAWVNFDGTQTAANMIRSSGNVSSITDGGVGIYTVNFTNALEDVDYSVCGTSSNGYGLSNYSNVTAPTTTSVKVITYAGGFADLPYNSVAIFR
jgi:hypothetical protein